MERKIFISRCADFLPMCEIHSKYYFSSNAVDTGETCCGTIFSPIPFFSNAGTCFTSHAEIWEFTPFTYSSIKVWLNIQTDNSPGLSFFFVVDVIV